MSELNFGIFHQFLAFFMTFCLLKMSDLNFIFLAFSTNFCPSKIGQSGNTVRTVASGFQKLAKLAFFDIFNENVNVARFARSQC